MHPFKRLGGWVRERKAKLSASSLHHEPFYVFDLSENFYIRYRCKTCDQTNEVSQGDDAPYTECECGSTDLEWLSGEELKVKEFEVA